MWNMSDNSWVKAAFASLFAPWLLGACVFVHQMPQFDAETLLDVSHGFSSISPVAPTTTEKLFLRVQGCLGLWKSFLFKAGSLQALGFRMYLTEWRGTPHHTLGHKIHSPAPNCSGFANVAKSVAV